MIKNSKIKHIVLGCLVAFSCFILLFLFLMQIVFLNKYYEVYKKNQLDDIVNSIKTNNSMDINTLEDIAYNSEILHKRGTKLVRLLKESNIPFFRYDYGFFLTLKVDDAFKVYDELKKKHIYIVPIAEKQVRIALSGINEEEIEILVKELKEII